jgi:hypothetical protein
MYDNAPQTYGTFESLRVLLNDTGGHLDTLDHREFAEGLDRRFQGRDLVAVLDEVGIAIGLREGEVLEKAGLIALLGTLKQIDAGKIQPGERTLVCLTGGTARPDGRVVPDCRIEDASQIWQIAVGDGPAVESQHG